MTTAIFWRFLWKEYRVMRAFWIAMAILAVLAQLSLAAFPGLTHYAAAWTFSFALIFPALYAVACGATMFAAEKEEGTYEFLRGLPVTAWRLLTGKLAFAVASTVLLIGVLWCIASAVSRTTAVDASQRVELWATFGFAAIEGLAWGMFFSLIMRRPLLAAILGIAAGSLVVNVVLWRTDPNAVEGHVYELGRYLTAVPIRSIIAAVVLAADVLLARRWLRAEKTAARRVVWRRPILSAIVSAAAATRVLRRPRLGPTLGRLIWQTWRQSWLTMAVVAVPGSLAVLLALVVVSALNPSMLLQIVISPQMAIALVPSLMGACVFVTDNERRSARFLVDHAVRPRQIWLARELTWMAALTAWVVVLHVIGFLFVRNGGLAGYSAMVILLPLAGFAGGQFASMLVRSGIVAAFVAVVLALVCSTWAILMRLFEVNSLWSFAPIPLVLLFATWLRTPDWLLERNTWRGWLRVGAALALPISALLIAVPLYRIYQIPDVSPGFSPDEFVRSMIPTPEEKKTAQMYLRAGDLLKFPKEEPAAANAPSPRDLPGTHKQPLNAWEREILRLNREPLEIALEASKRPGFTFHDYGFEFGNGPIDLARLLDISARQLESESKLDDAWERLFAALRVERCLQNNPWTYDQLPLWAAKQGQTRERIVAAIKQLDQFETTLRPPANHIKDEYLRLRPFVTGAPDVPSGLAIRGHTESLTLSEMLPWEHSRALRLLNVVTADNLSQLDTIVSGIAEGRPVIRLLRYSPARASSRYQQWLRTTFLLSACYFPSQDGEDDGRLFAMEVTVHRATHLVMALEAWKADHDGKLPERLNQLVGPYLDKLPRDPYTDRDFVYSRNGIALPDNFSRPWPPELSKAFIWSPGERVRPAHPAQNEVTINGRERLGPNDIEINDQQGWNQNRWRRAADEFEIWRAGEWFEIP